MGNTSIVGAAHILLIVWLSTGVWSTHQGCTLDDNRLSLLYQLSILVPPYLQDFLQQFSKYKLRKIIKRGKLFTILVNIYNVKMHI